MTRPTNAFSKRWENLRAAYALWFAWYNFAHIHQSLRITPAMRRGITNYVCSVVELVNSFYPGEMIVMILDQTLGPIVYVLR